MWLTAAPANGTPRPRRAARLWSGRFPLRGCQRGWRGLAARQSDAGKSVAVLAGWLLLGAAAASDTKLIRLRNETIVTPLPARPTAAQLQAVEAPRQGLFLVQFEGSFQSAWREQLRALRAELVKYVPDDSFVTRLDGVKLSQLKALPFVRWVGEYRPEHKVHRLLRQQPLLSSGSPVVLRVLLSPLAQREDVLALRSAFQSITHVRRSRLGTIVQGQLRGGRLAALARSGAVLWVEPASRMKLFDEVSAKLVGGDHSGGEPSHQTATQRLGFTGRSVVVAVADSGLQFGAAAGMHPDLAGRVDRFLFYGGLENAADEHGHGTHVTGIIAGDGATGETDENGFLYGLGVAPETHIVAQRVFDAEGKDYLPAVGVLTRDAVRAGAVIGSNSWGDDTQGRYDLYAAEFDALVRDADDETPGDQPYILEFSAGNAGPGAQSIGSPAVAKNVIASGASENDRFDFFIYAEGSETMADFSSRGPCEDGRIKPDVVAPGTWIASLQSAAATDENAWLPISENYQYQGGTSQSGPHVSGAAAVFVQYYRETHGGVTPSPALVKAALINSADDLDDAQGGTEPAPNVEEGWGRVNLANLIGSDRRFELLDQTVLLTNGQTFEQRVVVADPHEPLKITLAYTDAPGFPAAIPALVNDLDLEVVDPDGGLFRGNQFDRGQTIRDAEAADRLNNVEGVHLLFPEPGEYVVRVRAHHVVEDIHHRTNAPPRQDFALVISGDLALPGVGTVLLDRRAYNAPAWVRVRLIDFDLVGQPSANVVVKSTSESAGERLTLLPFGAGGVFTGAVATAVGPALPDGRLQLQHGDDISAEYEDAAPAALRRASAVADFVPPKISGVVSSSRFARVVLEWDTDEPTTGLVRYGPDASLGASVTKATLARHQEVVVPDLTPGTTYSFLVVATDEAGNAATDDNGGRLYTVVTPPAPTVLVVDAYLDPFGLFEIPVGTYTDALDQAGISYEVWDVAFQGRSPTLDELRPFRVVMWRVPELTAALSTADVKAIRDYVESGGGLFMASMELLTRLDEAGFTNFRKNVLHVESFETDVGVPAITGADNLSFSSAMQVELDYSAYPDLIIIPPDLSDTFQPATNATPVLFASWTGQAAGLRFPRANQASAGRVIFFSFPLDAVPLDGPAPNNRVELVRNVVSFLAPGAGGVGTLELDRTAYTLPSLVTVELADSDLAGRRSATVTFSSDRLPNGQELRLEETPQPGRFRGFLALVAETNVLTAGQSQARDGDRIEVAYQDASLARSIHAAAVVQTLPPAISEISVAPDYSEAVVSWRTSRPADALVQFGESSFLGRTAYAAEHREEHSLTLSGLLPDRHYYFQVVSRDAADNAATDDNSGKLYTFRTLKPLTPPFVDSLDSGATNWTVASESLDFEALSILETSVWQLGRPQNALASSAHSGANAWGTNLRGDGNDYANTSLISPAIELTGGNLATLRFWHNYNFLPVSEEGDLLELGGLFVTTNNGGLWIQLQQFEERSSGWEPVELDLTPYLGRVVRLGWAYLLFSIDAAAHPGWLLDDIAVTVSTAERGTVIVTNNLAQARFRLRGPVDQTGAGWGLHLTNAPPGTYSVEYEPVSYYATPPPQTNVLSGANTILFQGFYTFADVNTNGLSDAWERQFFGAVSPDHPPDRDTDGDGYSDYAEFIAGTNPTEPGSFLRVSLPAVQANRTVRLDWASAPSRAYRLQLSTDLTEWLPASAWLIAANGSSTITLPPLQGAAGYFFRVEVRP